MLHCWGSRGPDRPPGRTTTKSYTVYAAALPAAGTRSEAARALIAHLAKPESQRLFSAAGVEAAP